MDTLVFGFWTLFCLFFMAMSLTAFVPWVMDTERLSTLFQFPIYFTGIFVIIFGWIGVWVYVSAEWIGV